MSNISTLFIPKIMIKEKFKSHHPWEKTIKDVHATKMRYVHNSVLNPIFPDIKDPNKRAPIKFSVIGNRTCKEFIYSVHLVKGMHKYRSKIFDVPIIKGVTSVEWPQVWQEMKMKYGHDVFCLLSEVLILNNDTFFGGDKELKDFIESQYAFYLSLDFQKEAMKEFTSYVRSTGRPFAYLHISINNEPAGSLIFMLYSDIVPRTCENFLRLCTTKRGGYSGSPVHRIVKDGWIQCGGFNLKSTPLDCENYAVSFDRRGVLAMCNDGRNNDGSTQFFILLEPAQWMSNKYVAFGQLVDGHQTLKKIERVPTWYESPTQDILIYNSGVLNIDCKHHPINRSTQSYLSKHVEDLVTVGEIFIEALLVRVFAVVEAKHLKQLEDELYKRQPSGSLSSESSKADSIKSDNIIVLCGDNKENESINPSLVESFHTKFSKSIGMSSTSSSRKSVKRQVKPYYLAFTDIPYPDERSEDFDLKRFIQGDYCIECDLPKEIDGHKTKPGQTQKLINRELYSTTSEMFVDEHDRFASEYMDSDDEEQIKAYIRNNADRVSFAGGVIKQICKGAALYNLFEGHKSDLVVEDAAGNRSRRMSMYDRRQSIRKSEMIALTDEDIRKIRRASMFERRQSEISSKKPGSYGAGGIEEQLNKLRMFDQCAKSDDSDEKMQQLLNKKVSISVPRTDRSPSRIERRSTCFGLPGKLPPIKLPIILEDTKDEGDDDVGVNWDQLKKRRQTGFAEQLTRVKSYQKDFVEPSDEEEEEDEEERSDDETGKLKIKLPKAGHKVPKKIMRRPTGFVRKQDLEKIGITTEDEKGVRIDETESHLPSQIKRRQTGFVRKEDLKNISTGDDIEEEEEEEEDNNKNKEEEDKKEEGKKKTAGFASDVPDIDEEKSSSFSSSSDTHVTIAPTTDVPRTTSYLRRPTGFIRPQDLAFLTKNDDDDEEEEEAEEEDKNKEEKVEKEKDKNKRTGFASDVPDTDEKESSSSSSSSDTHVTIAPTTDVPRTTSYLRRPTGFIRPQDLAFLTKNDDEEEEEEEEEEEKYKETQAAAGAGGRKSVSERVKIAPTAELPRTTSYMRRPTGFIRPQDLAFLTKNDDEDEDEDKDEEEEEKEEQEKKEEEEEYKNKFTATTEAADKSYVISKLPLERKLVIEERRSSSDSDGPMMNEAHWEQLKKRRQTGFAEQLTRVKSYQKDFVEPSDEEEEEEEEEEEDEGTGKSTIRLPKAGRRTPKKIMRRPTGFVRKQDLEKIGITMEDEKGVKMDVSDQHVPSQIKRRQTGFIPKEQLKKMFEEDMAEEMAQDEEDVKYDDNKETNTTNLKNADDMAEMSLSSSSSTSATDQHGKTEQSTVSTSALRKSVLTRLYEDAMLVENAPPPTLKKYVPISERIPHNLLLTYVKKFQDETKESRTEKEKSYQIRPSIQVDNESFKDVVKSQFGMVSTKISDEYVSRLAQLEAPPQAMSLRSIEYARIRPSVTIAEYRRRNQERLKKMKEEKDKLHSNDHFLPSI